MKSVIVILMIVLLSGCGVEEIEEVETDVFTYEGYDYVLTGYDIEGVLLYKRDLSLESCGMENPYVLLYQTEEDIYDFSATVQGDMCYSDLYIFHEDIPITVSEAVNLGILNPVDIDDSFIGVPVYHIYVEERYTPKDAIFYYADDDVYNELNPYVLNQSEISLLYDQLQDTRYFMCVPFDSENNIFIGVLEITDTEEHIHSYEIYSLGYTISGEHMFWFYDGDVFTSFINGIE